MAMLNCPSLSDVSAPVRRRRIGPLDLLALWRQRRRLAELDARMLSDIGVTPAEAEREARRPVWYAPHHWLLYSAPAASTGVNKTALELESGDFKW